MRWCFAQVNADTDRVILDDGDKPEFCLLFEHDRHRNVGNPGF